VFCIYDCLCLKYGISVSVHVAVQLSELTFPLFCGVVCYALMGTINGILIACIKGNNILFINLI
jgi:hypothetical protein